MSFFRRRKKATNPSSSPLSARTTSRPKKSNGKQTAVDASSLGSMEYMGDVAADDLNLAIALSLSLQTEEEKRDMDVRKLAISEVQENDNCESDGHLAMMVQAQADAEAGAMNSTFAGRSLGFVQTVLEEHKKLVVASMAEGIKIEPSSMMNKNYSPHDANVLYQRGARQCHRRGVHASRADSARVQSSQIKGDDAVSVPFDEREQNNEVFSTATTNNHAPIIGYGKIESNYQHNRSADDRNRPEDMSGYVQPTTTGDRTAQAWARRRNNKAKSTAVMVSTDAASTTTRPKSHAAPAITRMPCNSYRKNKIYGVPYGSSDEEEEDFYLKVGVKTAIADEHDATLSSSNNDDHQHHSSSSCCTKLQNKKLISKVPGPKIAAAAATPSVSPEKPAPRTPKKYRSSPTYYYRSTQSRRMYGIPYNSD